MEIDFLKKNFDLNTIQILHTTLLMVRHLKNFFRPLYYWLLNNYYSMLGWLGGGILPDFIIIGTQKGGTTSLYHYLSQHSQIAEASKKEVHFFDHNYKRGKNWYKAHFLKAASLKRKNPSMVAGEGSPYYVYHPYVAERIAKTLPHIKLILVLREPAARAFSHYKHNVSRGKYDRPLTFREAVEFEEQHLNVEKEKMAKNPFYDSVIHDIYSLKDRGLYQEQIERYYQYFDKTQLLIITAEGLFKSPKEEMRKVCDFLNVEYIDFAVEKIYNQNKMKIEADTAFLKELKAYYKPYNERLYEFLGHQFDWEK